LPEPGGTKARNTSAILRTILARGPIARSRIAEATGLSHASLSRLTTDLVAQRYLREIEPQRPAEAGRPLVPIDFDTTWLALGMHVGRDRTTFAAADLRGRLVARADVPHPEREPEALVAHALRTLPHAVGPRGRAQKALGLGVSVGGWVDPDRGIVVENDALGWRDVGIRTMLARHLSIPVLVESNVRAMALAELWFGAATSAQSLVYVFIGNVVGAALVVGRTIHRGPLSAAGGIAHMRLSSGSARCSCGRDGCFQAMATDMGLVERALAAGVIRERSIDALIAAARDGDSAARTLLELRARAIGEALAAIIGLINPDLVVLAGSGVTAAPEFFPTIRAEAQRRCVLPIDAETVIRPAAAGTDVLGLSATALVLDAFYRQTLPQRAKRTLSA
jgi:predicted NBD/HSP70 family sugar kinase